MRAHIGGAVKKVRRKIWLIAGLVQAVVLVCTALATLWAYKDIKKLPADEEKEKEK